MLEELKKVINERHSKDKEQLDVIFDENNRLLVEAPAGYGKTKTMVSKIAYLIASGQIKFPKKILALTFSVNAAYKIKKDTLSQLPQLLTSINNINVGEKIYISNYHGLSRQILRRYGYLLHENLKSIDVFENIDDANQERLTSHYGLSLEEAKLLSDFNDFVRDSKMDQIRNNFDLYNNLVIKRLIPQSKITFNSILTLTIKIFKDFPNINSFYSKYFKFIIVDEYQDTNLLSFSLLNRIIKSESKIILIGDPLQRIYGFIGAVNGLLDKSKEKYNLEKVIFKLNYRFKNNPNMLLLDKNIRLNAAAPYNPQISNIVKVNFNLFNNQEDEARGIKNLIANFNNGNNGNNGLKIVILFRQRNQNTTLMLNHFNNLSLNYFYGLFTDEDLEYVSFHKYCSSQLRILLHSQKITKGFLLRYKAEVNKHFKKTTSPTINSLLKLLNTFTSKFLEDYRFFDDNYKLNFLIDTFENNGLKQYMEFIDSPIVISTIHAAKGLEWDFVVLADMEQYSFPNWLGLCGSCTNRNNCNFSLTNGLESSFLDELSVFYVGVTRAKRGVYFTASKTRLNFNGIENNCNVSCFLKLPGLSIN